MRRSKGKLTSLNWQLVLFAGIFQILTFVFDQIVIQYEEKNRENNFQILTKSESRSAYLKMNNRINDFMLAFENTVFLVSSSSFTENRKKYYYYSNIFDQTRLLEDILNDSLVTDGLKDRKIKASDREDENLSIKEFGFKEYFELLIDDNYWLTEQLEKNPDFVIEVDGVENSALRTIKAYVEHNNYYLQYLLDAMAELNNSTSEELDKIIKLSSTIETRKQLILLLGVVAQLLSLLCLLILFRRLLINKA